jgi:hypothetical protein
MGNKRRYDPSIKDDLDKADWPSIVPRLIKYAKYRIFVLEQIGLPMTYEDIAIEAISKLYGKGDRDSYRNWDKDKYPDLFLHLKCVVREIIRREISKIAVYHEEPIENENSEQKILAPAEDALNMAHIFIEKTPDDLCVDKECLGRLYEALQNATANNNNLENVAICITNGTTASRDIAQELGLDIDEVYNLKRKLKRRLEKNLVEIKNNTEITKRTERDLK